MEVSNHHSNTALFSGLIKNLPGISSADKENLDKLALKYPYSQIIAALHCKTVSQDQEGFNQKITKAAILFSRRETLHHFIYEPEKLVPLKEYTAEQGNNILQDFEEIPERLEPQILTDAHSDDNITQHLDGKEYENNPEAENELADRFDVLSSGTEENRPKEEEEQLTQVKEELTEEAIEVMQEISDIHTQKPTELKEDTEPYIHDTPPSDLKDTTPETTTYFAFDSPVETTISHLEEPSATIPLASHPTISTAQITKTNQAGAVSNYNDPKLPYTFLWWLDKTRKEHSQQYQPYATSTQAIVEPAFKPTQQASISPLDQQIIEHIFHLQSPLAGMQHSSSVKTVEFKLNRKEDELIERFIKEEPQIKPLKAEQITNENKARKSAVDVNDLVSETLANIYIEQMLYHKAIDTYKKLSLKFPDKKLYFANQISELEKKLN